MEADITGGGPSKHVDSLHYKSVLPSLTAEASIAGGLPVDLLAAESRRLMLVIVHTHRSSDSASSVF